MTRSSAAEIAREKAGSVGTSPTRLGKRLLKRAARGLALVLITPLYLSYRVRSAVLGEQAFRASSQLLSLLPGLVGDFLRGEFYRLTLAGWGRDVQVCFGTLLSSCDARIGDNVYIGPCCNLGSVEVGRDVLLGSGVHLISGPSQHGIGDLSRPIRLQSGLVTRITVGEDSWIGNGSIVMANIGRQCVIGAGSVVVSDVPDRSIAVGNPARVIRGRE